MISSDGMIFCAPSNWKGERLNLSDDHAVKSVDYIEPVSERGLALRTAEKYLIILLEAEEHVLKRSSRTVEDIYKAEWEGQRPHMSPFLVGDDGPMQPPSRADFAKSPRDTLLLWKENRRMPSIGSYRLN